MQSFQINDAMANFFSLADTAAFYAKVMGAWRHFAEVLPISHHVVRYEDLVEDLVEDFAAETARLFDFLGLAWDDAVLDYADHARSRDLIGTPSYHQVTQPIYREARYRWQRYRDQLAPVIETLGPYAEAFGYES